MMRFLKNLAGKAKSVIKKMKSKFDNCGSYTGTPEGRQDEQSEQDADDL